MIGAQGNPFGIANLLAMRVSGIADMEIELQNQHALTTAIANALKADDII